MILNFKSLPLDKQDFTHSSLNLHWAFTLDNKNGGEIKLSLQLKITTPESDKRKLVFKAFYVTSIGSIQISSKFAVIVIALFSVLFLPSDCKVSKTSYLIRLNSKLLKFEILALCFRDWNRYFYQDRKSMSSICVNWEIMFVQDELSRATWNRS